MELHESDVLEALARGEGRTIEFKRGLSREGKVARTLCAFANTRGGLLLVGVTDRGRIEGVPRPREVVEELRAVAAEEVEPPLAIELRAVRAGGAWIVGCSVPLSPARPHRVRRADGTDEVVVRLGSSNRAADGATLRALGQSTRLRGALDPLERRVLEWVRSRGTDETGGGATVAGFARAQNIGVQRARRAFLQLERDGRLIAHGTGTRRIYALP
ncbi:MAG TPA: ATP-binding protein [Planctomycetota bacterium]|nr:ATP-binding protein [Planctomycetota bacterium]